MLSPHENSRQVSIHMKDSSEEKYTHIGIIMPNDGLICGKHYFIMFILAIMNMSSYLSRYVGNMPNITLRT